MTQWSWAAARARGTSHEKSGAPCQDAFQCRQIGETLAAFVADGAGSAEFGGQGAALACRTIVNLASAQLEGGQGLPDDQTLWAWIDAARDRIAAAAERRNANPRSFASTFIGVLAAPDATLVFHVGDGAAALRSAGGESWSVPLWPAHGEYASTTFFLTDDPAPQLRIERMPAPCSAAVLMSDGLERLALDFAAQQPHSPFFDGIARPVADRGIDGADRRLSAQLRAYLGSDAVNARTDDDKTLVVAIRR